jgi:hypothetical protein
MSPKSGCLKASDEQPWPMMALLPLRHVARILEGPGMGAWATTGKEAAVRQLTLGFVGQQTRVIALEPDVEKAVVAMMAQMIEHLVQKQERSSDDRQTDQQ